MKKLLEWEKNNQTLKNKRTNLNIEERKEKENQGEQDFIETNEIG